MHLIGITGKAGSGKDTAAEYIDRLSALRVKRHSFAEPLKEFARKIFGFSKEQLYGPSHMRNAADKRISLPAYSTPLVGKLMTTVARAAVGGRVMRERNKIRIRFLMESRRWLQEVLDPEIAADKKRLHEAYRLLDTWLEDNLAKDVITPRYVLQTLGTEWGRKVDEMVWVKYVLRNIKNTDRLFREDTIHVITDVRFLNEGQAVLDAGGEVWRVRRPGTKNLTAGAKGHQSEAEMDSPEWDALVSRTILNDMGLDDLKLEVAVNLDEFMERPTAA